MESYEKKLETQHADLVERTKQLQTTQVKIGQKISRIEQQNVSERAMRTLKNIPKPDQKNYSTEVDYAYEKAKYVLQFLPDYTEKIVNMRRRVENMQKKLAGVLTDVNDLYQAECTLASQ